MNYAEPICIVASYLTEAGVPYTINRSQDGWQMCFYEWCDGDLICHSWSVGHSDGWVETYQFPWDEGDVTSMSPEDAAWQIIEYYKSRMGA